MTDSTRPEAQGREQSVDGSAPGSQGPRDKSEPGSGRNQGNKQGLEPSKRAPPPKLTTWEKVFLWGSRAVALVAGLYLAEQFCQAHAVSWMTEHLPALAPALAKGALRPCVWGTYIAFGAMLGALLAFRVFRHEQVTRKARLEDPSEIDALLLDARTVESRLIGSERPDGFEKKKAEVEKEADRLEKIGKDAWTEYEVLSLSVMLVDLLKKDELKAQARSRLAELEGYAEDAANQYDWQQYSQWEQRIQEAIEKVEDAENDSAKKDTTRSGEDKTKLKPACEQLRAEQRALLEHVAEYQLRWAKGSATVRGIVTYGAVAIPLLIGMGLLPILHPDGDGLLGPLNWGILGVSGAMAAVLRNLRNSKFIEVGDTQGRKALWDTVAGAALGFIAAIVGYALIAGGLFLPGGIVPSLGEVAGEDHSSLSNIGRSILWAVASGFCFEEIFARMRSATVGGG